MRGYKQSGARGQTDCNAAVFADRVIRVIKSSRQRIIEHCYRLVKRHTVFLNIFLCFYGIPFKMHNLILKVAWKITFSFKC
jgi:presenilin-like A22 family membrane protease